MNAIQVAFQEGGWGMWPTLFFGTLALALAIRHAVKPQRELMPLIIGLGGATLFAGCLGLTVGLMTTIKYTRVMPPPDRTVTTLIGVAESLQNIGLALVMAVLICLFSGVGSWRRARATAA